MKFHHTNIFFLAVLSLIFSACATVVPPAGGPVDTTPPVPLSFIPNNKTTNFKAKKIVIKFDEYIELKALNSQMVVSPSMPKEPEVVAQGKKLIINLPDSLDKDVTYTIFLGNAVVNFKEGLPLQHFQYVLSTGSTMDSLMILGTVKNAFNLKTEEGLIVMLYKNTADSTPLLHRPYYISKTYANGEYKLANISPGKYLMFVLKDLNSNYIYDQPAEEIAFVDSLVIPAPEKPANDSLNLFNTVKVDFFLFKELEKRQGINRKIVLKENKIELDFKRPTHDLSMELLNIPSESQWYYPVYSTEKDTLTAWITAKVPDTIDVKVTEANVVIDTVRFVLKKAEKKPLNISRKNKNENLTQDSAKTIVKIAVKANAVGTLDFFRKPTLNFNTPIKTFSSEKIQLFKLKDSIFQRIPTNLSFSDENSKMNLEFNVNLEESTTYKIFIKDSVFFDVFNNTNDTVDIKFTTTKKRNYGSLKLTVKNQDSIPMIVQLMNEKDVVLYQNVLIDSVLNYPYLLPGTYKMKAIRDKNGNGKWDTGNYLQRILPERVYFLGTSINIRPNWDVEQKWEL